MATIKSYTDLEQSKKLAEILPLESADMYIYKTIFFGALSCFNGNTQIGEYIKLADKESKAYPCWSLAALLNMFDDKSGLAKDYNSWYCYDNGTPHCTKHHTNAIDAVFEMIVWLKENEKLYDY